MRGRYPAMMYGIYLILIAFAMMAKAKGRGRPRRRFNLRRVRITAEEALLTLGSDTAFTQTLTGTSANRYRLVSAKISWALTNLTAGEGPIHVGFAHSDYSVTEIKECIESQTSIDINDKVANERAQRLVRTVGVLRGVAGGAVLNDGKPITTRLNWLIGIGQSVNFFSWNEGTAALTTGVLVTLTGDIWVRD